MSSSFWLLGVESHDFFQAEKERTACKAEQIHKMTTISTQNDNLGPFWVKIVVSLWICSALQAVLSISAREKSRDSTPNSQKLEDMCRAQKCYFRTLKNATRWKKKPSASIISWFASPWYFSGIPPKKYIRQTFKFQYAAIDLYGFGIKYKQNWSSWRQQ